MASKFAEFLGKNKIDPRRVPVASRQIECLRPEDRKLKRLKKKPEASSGGGDDKEKAASPEKPRSGRPVTPRLLSAAKEGKPISGPQKHRLLRAVNRILEQKKKDPTDLRALF
jgi:hypothetical protein